MSTISGRVDPQMGWSIDPNMAKSWGPPGFGRVGARCRKVIWSSVKVETVGPLIRPSLRLPPLLGHRPLSRPCNQKKCKLAIDKKCLKKGSQKVSQKKSQRLSHSAYLRQWVNDHCQGHATWFQTACKSLCALKTDWFSTIVTFLKT